MLEMAAVQLLELGSDYIAQFMGRCGRCSFVLSGCRCIIGLEDIHDCGDGGILPCRSVNSSKGLDVACHLWSAVPFPQQVVLLSAPRSGYKDSAERRNCVQVLRSVLIA